MYYCENCHVALEKDRCEFCGNKGLPVVQDMDYCLLFNEKKREAERLSGLLEEAGIPTVLQSYGDGVRAIYTLELDRTKVYVPYVFLKRAEELVKEWKTAECQSAKEELLEKASRLHISPKTEKKLLKKWKRAGITDVLALCREIILDAVMIEDRGIASKTDPKDPEGRYVFILSEQGDLLLNSATLEVYGVNLKK